MKQQSEIVSKNSAGSSQLGWFTGPMCYMSTPIGKKRKRKEKSALKLIKTNQQVKHCIRIKNLLFVNTNTNHVPKSGYNQIDVARIVFIFVCVRVCVLFCYWLSHVIAIAHRWIIGWLSKVLRSYLTLSKLRPTWIEDKMYPSKCMKLKSVRPLSTLLKSV